MGSPTAFAWELFNSSIGVAFPSATLVNTRHMTATGDGLNFAFHSYFSNAGSAGRTVQAYTRVNAAGQPTSSFFEFRMSTFGAFGATTVGGSADNYNTKLFVGMPQTDNGFYVFGGRDNNNLNLPGGASLTKLYIAPSPNGNKATPVFSTILSTVLNLGLGPQLTTDIEVQNFVLSGDGQSCLIHVSALNAAASHYTSTLKWMYGTISYNPPSFNIQCEISSTRNFYRQWGVYSGARLSFDGTYFLLGCASTIGPAGTIPGQSNTFGLVNILKINRTTSPFTYTQLQTLGSGFIASYFGNGTIDNVQALYAGFRTNDFPHQYPGFWGSGSGANGTALTYGMWPIAFGIDSNCDSIAVYDSSQNFQGPSICPQGTCMLYRRIADGVDSWIADSISGQSTFQFGLGNPFSTINFLSTNSGLGIGVYQLYNCDPTINGVDAFGRFTFSTLTRRPNSRMQIVDMSLDGLKVYYPDVSYGWNIVRRKNKFARFFIWYQLIQSNIPGMTQNVGAGGWTANNTLINNDTTNIKILDSPGFEGMLAYDRPKLIHFVNSAPTIPTNNSTFQISSMYGTSLFNFPNGSPFAHSITDIITKMGTNYTDPNEVVGYPGPLDKGIAIISSPSNAIGYWTWGSTISRLIPPQTWQPISGGTTSTNAFLVPEITYDQFNNPTFFYLRFSSIVNSTATSFLQFRAWDQTAGNGSFSTSGEALTYINTVGRTGGNSSISINNAIAFMSVIHLNIPPSINNLPSIPLSSVWGDGGNVATTGITTAQLSTIIGPAYSDPDMPAFSDRVGLAIISSATYSPIQDYGRWQVSTSALNWSNISPSTSYSTAFLLPISTQVWLRFSPFNRTTSPLSNVLNANSIFTLTLAPWDQTRGTGLTYYTNQDEGGNRGAPSNVIGSAIGATSTLLLLSTARITRAPSFSTNASSIIAARIGQADFFVYNIADIINGFGATYDTYDLTANRGLLVYQANNDTAGAWEFSTSWMSQWSTLNPRSTNAIFMSGSNSFIRFNAVTNTPNNSWITCVPWNTDTFANYSTVDITAPVSYSTSYASFTSSGRVVAFILGSNFRPGLNGATPPVILSSVFGTGRNTDDGTTNLYGHSIQNVITQLGTNFIDSDTAGNIRAIALNSLPQQAGTWYYNSSFNTFNPNANWQPIPTNITSTLVFTMNPASNSRIALLPNINYTSTYTVRAYLWDGTDRAPSFSTVDVSQLNVITNVSSPYSWSSISMRLQSIYLQRAPSFTPGITSTLLTQFAAPQYSQVVPMSTFFSLHSNLYNDPDSQQFVEYFNLRYYRSFLGSYGIEVTNNYSTMLSSLFTNILIYQLRTNHPANEPAKYGNVIMAYIHSAQFWPFQYVGFATTVNGRDWLPSLSTFANNDPQMPQFGLKSLEYDPYTSTFFAWNLNTLDGWNTIRNSNNQPIRSTFFYTNDGSNWNGVNFRFQGNQIICRTMAWTDEFAPTRTYLMAGMDVVTNYFYFFRTNTPFDSSSWQYQQNVSIENSQNFSTQAATSLNYNGTQWVYTVGTTGMPLASLRNAYSWSNIFGFFNLTYWCRHPTTSTVVALNACNANYIYYATINPATGLFTRMGINDGNGGIFLRAETTPTYSTLPSWCNVIWDYVNNSFIAMTAGGEIFTSESGSSFRMIASNVQNNFQVGAHLSGTRPVPRGIAITNITQPSPFFGEWQVLKPLREWQTLANQPLGFISSFLVENSPGYAIRYVAQCNSTFSTSITFAAWNVNYPTSDGNPRNALSTLDIRFPSYSTSFTSTTITFTVFNNFVRVPPFFSSLQFVSSISSFSTYTTSSLRMYGTQFNLVDNTQTLYGTSISELDILTVSTFPQLYTGYVLTQVPTQVGTWLYTSSYSIANPQWTAIPPSFSASTSLTLNISPSTRIAFLPFSDITSTYRFNMRLWDSNNLNYPVLSTLDTSFLDSLDPFYQPRFISSPFSLSSLTFLFNVIAINDRPRITFDPLSTLSIGTSYASIGAPIATISISTLVGSAVNNSNFPANRLNWVDQNQNDSNFWYFNMGGAANTLYFRPNRILNAISSVASIGGFNPNNWAGKTNTMMARGRNTWVFASMWSFSSDPDTTVAYWSYDGSNFYPSRTSIGSYSGTFCNNNFVLSEVRYFEKDDIFVICWNLASANTANRVPTYAYSLNGGIDWTQIDLPGSTIGTTIYGAQNVPCSTSFLSMTYMSNAADPFYVALGAWAYSLNDTNYSSWNQNYGMHIFRTKTPWIRNSWVGTPIPGAYTATPGDLYRSTLGRQGNSTAYKPWLTWLGQDFIITNWDNNILYLHSTLTSGRVLQLSNNATAFPSTTDRAVRFITNPSLTYGFLTVWGEYTHLLTAPITNGTLSTNGLVFSSIFNTTSNYNTTGEWDDDRFVVMDTNDGNRIYHFYSTLISSYTVSLPAGYSLWSMLLYPFKYSAYRGLIITSAPSNANGYWQISSPIFSYFNTGTQPWLRNPPVPATGSGGWSTLIIPPSTGLAVVDTNLAFFRWFPTSNVNSVQTLSAVPYDWSQFIDLTFVNISTTQNLSSPFSTTTINYTLQIDQLLSPPFISSATTSNRSTVVLSTVWATGFNTVDNTANIVGNSLRDIHNIMSTFYFDLDNYRPGYVLTSLPAAAGTWYWTSTVQGPLQWFPFPSSFNASTSFTFNVNVSTRIALVANVDVLSTYTASFRLWKGTDNSPFFSTVDTSWMDSSDPIYALRFISSSYSLSTFNIAITTLPVNARPIFTVPQTSTLFLGSQVANRWGALTALGTNPLSVYSNLTSSFGTGAFIDGDAIITKYLYLQTGIGATARVGYSFPGNISAISTIVSSFIPGTLTPGNSFTAITTNNLSYQLNPFAYGKNIFLNGGTNPVIFSLDGKTWGPTRLSSLGHFTSLNFYSNDNIWIYSGFGSNITGSLGNTYWYSFNAIDWTPVALTSTLSGVSKSTFFTSITYTSNWSSPYYLALASFGSTSNGFYDTNTPFVLYRTTTPWISSSWSTISLPTQINITTGTAYTTSIGWKMNFIGNSWLIYNTSNGTTDWQIYVLNSTFSGSNLGTTVYSPAITPNVGWNSFFITPNGGFINTFSPQTLYRFQLSNGNISSYGNGSIFFSSVGGTGAGAEYLAYDGNVMFGLSRAINPSTLSNVSLSFTALAGTTVRGIGAFSFSSLRGFAITNAPSTSLGVWQISSPLVSITGGWSTLLNISPQNALLVPEVEPINIRFFNFLNITSTPSITVIPWDQTQNFPFTLIDTTIQNFSSAISSTPLVLRVSTLFAPAPPILSTPQNVSLVFNASSIWGTGANRFDNTTIVYGDNIKNLFDSISTYVIDENSTANGFTYSTSLAVRSLTGIGTWYWTSSFSTVALNSPDFLRIWTPMPPVADSNLFLFDPNPSACIYFLPTFDLAQQANFTVRAWHNRNSTLPIYSTVNAQFLSTPQIFDPQFISTPFSWSTATFVVSSIDVNISPNVSSGLNILLSSFFSLPQFSPVFDTLDFANRISTNYTDLDLRFSTYIGLRGGPGSFYIYNVSTLQYSSFQTPYVNVAQSSINAGLFATDSHTFVAFTQRDPSGINPTIANPSSIISYSYDGLNWRGAVSRPATIPTNGSPAQLRTAFYVSSLRSFIYIPASTAIYSIRGSITESPQSFLASPDGIIWSSIVLYSTNTAGQNLSSFPLNAHWAAAREHPTDSYILLMGYFGTTARRTPYFYRSQTPWIQSSWSSVNTPFGQTNPFVDRPFDKFIWCRPFDYWVGFGFSGTLFISYMDGNFNQVAARGLNGNLGMDGGDIAIASDGSTIVYSYYPGTVTNTLNVLWHTVGILGIQPVGIASTPTTALLVGSNSAVNGHRFFWDSNLNTFIVNTGSNPNGITGAVNPYFSSRDGRTWTFISSIGNPTGIIGTAITAHTSLFRSTFQKGFIFTDVPRANTGYWQFFIPEIGFSTVYATSNAAWPMWAHPAFKVQFVPTANLTSTYTISYVAWDGTQGTPGGLIDTTVPYNFSSAWTATTATFQVSTLRYVFPPSLSSFTSTISFSTVRADLSTITPISVSSFITFISSIGVYRDGIIGDPRALAITSNTGIFAHGVWQASTSGIPVEWSSIGPASDAAAITLISSAFLRFSTFLNVNSTFFISFKAWNQGDFPIIPPLGPLNTVPPPVAGSTYSASSILVWISTQRFNMAPSLTANIFYPLSTVFGDASYFTTYSIQSLSTLLSTNFTDPDASRGFPKTPGIIITSLASGTTGLWQLSSPLITTGGPWSTLSNITTTNSLVLSFTAPTSIRFLPTSNIPSTFALQFRAWTSFQYDNFSTVNLTTFPAFGLSTSFSLNTNTFFVSSVRVNPKPALPNGNLLLQQSTILANTVNGAGFSIKSIVDWLGANYIDPTLTLSQNPNPKGLALVYAPFTSAGMFEFSTATTGWAPIITPFPLSTNKALVLLNDTNNANRIRFSPYLYSNYTSTYTLQFRLWNQTDGIANGTQSVDTSYADPPTANFSTPYSHSTFTVFFSTLFINHSPTLPSSMFYSLPPVNGPFITRPFSTDLVSTFLGTDLQDYDFKIGQVPGLALIEIRTSSLGVWQLSSQFISEPFNSGWSTLGSISTNNALLIDMSTNATFRWYSTSNINLSTTLRFIPWDRTNYSPLQTVNIKDSDTGGSTVFGFIRSTITIFQQMSQTNTSPFLLSNTLRVSAPTIYANGYTLTGSFPNPPITTFNISSLIGTNYKELDSPSLYGLALVYASQQPQGQWMFSMSQTPFFSSIQPSISTNTAITFAFSTSVSFYFSTAQNQNIAGNYSLKFRLWDQTDGLSTGTQVDLSALDNPDPNFYWSTAYSQSTFSLTLSTLRFNTRPSISSLVQVPLPIQYGDPFYNSPLPVSLLSTAISSLYIDTDTTHTTRGFAIYSISSPLIPNSTQTYFFLQVQNLPSFSWQTLTGLSTGNAYLLPALPNPNLQFQIITNYNSTFQGSFQAVAWDQTQFTPFTNVSLVSTGTGILSPFSELASTVQFTFTIQHVNHSPIILSTSVFTGSTFFALSNVPVQSDSGAYGTSAVDILVLASTNYVELDDITTRDPKGLALIAATNDSRGLWYWGSTLQGNNTPYLAPVPNVAENAAFLFTPSVANRFRFIPFINSTFTASLTFRAWDQTDNYLNAYSNVNTAFMSLPIPNPSTAYSASTFTIQFNSVQYPLAPVLSNGPALLSNVPGDLVSPPGLPISQLLAAYSLSSFFPVDRDRPGIAITTVLSTTMGRWQISTPATNWSTLHIPTDAQAAIFLTSNDNNLIRFVPSYNSNSTVNLTFRLWNQRLFDNLSTAITQFPTLPNEYLSTTWSYSTALLYFSVIHINHAPFLEQPSARIQMADAYYEDTTYVGNTTRQLIDFLSTNYKEIDEGDRRGLAIVGTTVGSGGKWEISTPTQQWTAFPSPLSDSSALLLSSLTNVYVRFSTSVNLNFTASFVFRLWDGYDDFPNYTYPYAIPATGGNSSYSPTLVSAITQVYRVNHAPVLAANTVLQFSTAFADPVYQNPIPSMSIKNILEYLITNGQYTDSDFGDATGLGIVFAPSTSAGTWQVTNQFGFPTPSWTSIHVLSTTSTYVLASNITTAIRFLSYSNVASTYTMLFKGWDQTDGTPSFRYSTFSTFGGSNPLSLSTGVFFLSTVPVNHAPVLQANTISYASSIIPYDPLSILQYQALSVSSLITLLGNKATDNNKDNLGIAITYANAGSVAQWQIAPGDPNIFTDRVSFQTLPTVDSATQSYVLPSSVFIRLFPTPGLNINSSFVLRYRLWDTTTDSPYATVNTLSPNNGLSTAYSVNEGTLILSTLRMNIPPTLPANDTLFFGSTLLGLPATNFGTAMTELSTLISTNLTLNNPTDNLGFAWFGLASNTAGYWQISSPVYTTSPGGWSTILTTQSPASAYFVPASQSVRIRFVPTQNLNSAQTANFYAWNQQELQAYTFRVPPTNLSTSVSLNYNTLVVSTLFTNYAPSINTTSYTYGPFSGLNIGNDGITILQLLTNMSAFDLNGDSLGVAITSYSTILGPPLTPTAAIQAAPDTGFPYSWTTIYSTPTDGTIGTQAFTIPPNSRIRISTFSNTQGGFLLNLFAWDQTRGSPFSFNSIASLQTAQPQFGSLSYNSNTNQALSSVARMNVDFIFNAPQLLNNITLSTIRSLPSTNLGNTIGTIISTLGDLYIDSNFGQLGTGKGIGLFDVFPRDSGRWEFTTNGWTTFTEISTTWNLNTSSFLFKGSGTNSTLNAIRFRPTFNWSQQARFSFYAWDERFYANGSFVFISTNLQGGQSTFSISSATAFFSTQQVFLAPSTTMSTIDFGSFYADNTNNPVFGNLASEGFYLQNVLNRAEFKYFDPNVPGASVFAGNDTNVLVKGMAVISATGLRGQWYYTSNATNWYELNVVSPSTFLLPENSWVKFSSFSNETKTATIQWAAWSRFKYLDYTYVSSITSATGPNEPFSPSPYPTLLCNLTRINLPPTIVQGTLVYDISNFYTVSFDNADNLGFSLTDILTLPYIGYNDPYNDLRGIIITPIQFTFNSDNPNATFRTGGSFSNNLTLQTAAVPRSSINGVPVPVDSMLLYSTSTTNPRIYFTVSNDRTNFNRRSKVGFVIRAFNGCNLTNVQQSAQNGSVVGPLPPFDVHGAFSLNTIAFSFDVFPAVDMPQFSSNIPIPIPNIFENATNSIYLTVPMMSTAITPITPTDPALIGYFVSRADSTNGTWFFTLDGGTTSNAFRLGTTDVLTLSNLPGAGVKFVPGPNYVGSASISFGIYTFAPTPIQTGVVFTTNRTLSQKRFSAGPEAGSNANNDFTIRQGVSRFISPYYPVAIFLSTFSQNPQQNIPIMRGGDTTAATYIRSQRIQAITQFVLQQQADSTQYFYNFNDYEEYTYFQVGLRERGYLDNLTRAPNNPAPTPTLTP